MTSNALKAKAVLEGLKGAAAFFDKINVGLWFLNFGTNELWHSAATYAIHERALDVVPNLEMELATYTPEARARLNSAIEKARQEGSSWTLVLPQITDKGRPIMVRAAGAAFGEAGNVFALAGTFEDVTLITEQAQERERFGHVIEQMSTAAVLTDPAGHAVWVNPAFERVTGRRVDQAFGQSLMVLLRGEGTDKVMADRIAAAVEKGVCLHDETSVRLADGSLAWFDFAISPTYASDGALAGHLVLFEDVTARRDAALIAQAQLEEFKQTRTLLTDIIDALPAYLVAFSADDRLIMMSKAMKDRWPAFAEKVVPGMPIIDLVRSWLENEGTGLEGAGPPSDALVQQRVKMIVDGLSGNERRLADGVWLYSSSRRSEAGNLLWVRSDITDLKNAQLLATEMASRDALTGLLNRAGFLAALDDIRAKAIQEPAAFGCLLIIDVDHFKSLNDTYGHAAGDRMLKVAAERIAHKIGPGDIAGRLGGDEFAVFVSAPLEKEARRRVNELFAALSRPIMVEGNRTVSSVSIGIVFVGDDQSHTETWLRHADRALYEAKRNGRGRIVFYSDRLAEELSAKQVIAQRLRRALNRNEVDIALQPQALFVNGSVVGFEALARWQDRGQWISPALFVSAAEEYGVAERFGFYILRKALAACQILRERSGIDLRVSVNVSNIQLMSEEFADHVLMLLRELHLPGSALELEIVETVLIDRTWERLNPQLEKLRAEQVRIALDDFGTGHASLSHLTSLAVDALKIDQSFVQGIGKDRRSELLARTIINLAHGLELSCIAEGVETVEQYTAIRAMGCDVVQGYFYARPMSLQACLAFLDQQNTLPPSSPLGM